MCLAVPMRIQSIDGVMAQAEVGGVLRVVSAMLTPDARVGDYVLVHAGYAISVVDEEEAQATLQLLDEIAAMSDAQDEGEPIGP
jgi:hydrogenase expression/formation protein HypC